MELFLNNNNNKLIIMELIFDDEVNKIHVNPSDYESFDEFWEALPKKENEEDLMPYKPNVDFININNLDLTYPTTKEDMKYLCEFILELNNWDDDEDRQDFILYGLKFNYGFNLNTWDEFNSSNACMLISDIEEMFYGISYNDADVAENYLREYVDLNERQIEIILGYFDYHGFVDDNFNSNYDFYYTKN